MASLAQDHVFQKEVLIANSLLPALLIGWDYWLGQLGANPIEFVTRATGILTMVFLLITLVVTPFRKIFKCPWLARHRRMCGLFAAFYGLAHFLTYLVFDRGFKLETVPADVWKRPFIAAGALSFFLMVPLAVTSTNAMIKRLGGKRWARLHRLTYVVAIAGVAHYWMIVKSDLRWPAGFAAVLTLLLGYRLFARERFTPNHAIAGKP